MSKIVLGKGLGALIPSDENKNIEEKKYQIVALDLIAPNPMQPRRFFDEESLQQLSDSIKRDGLMQPLVVKKNGSNYTIVAGERRFRAARLAGLDSVSVILSGDIDDVRMLELALIENIQREDLNPMETAEAYQKLLVDCALTQQELSDRVGKNRTTVANTIRLNNLPEEVKQLVRMDKLSEGHARAILSLSEESEMIKMAHQIIENSLSVRQIENITPKKKRRRLIPKRNLPTLVELENYLKRLMGTSVRIKHGLKRGKIEIEYYSNDDLDRLMDLFRKIENTNG